MNHKYSRWIHKPIVIVAGLLFLCVGSLALVHHTAYAVASGCTGVQPSMCSILNIQLNPKPTATATVTVTREKTDAPADNTFSLTQGWGEVSNEAISLIDGTDTGKYTSGNGINGTDTVGGTLCINAPTDLGNYIDITVSGSATGTLKHVGICGGGLVNATVNVNLTGTTGGKPPVTNTDGGIKGGPFSGLTPTSQTATEACTGQVSGAIITGGTNSTQTLDNTGSFNTGLALKPGTYSVSITCITGTEGAGPTGTTQLDFSGVVVKAGQITALGSQTCSAGSGQNCTYTCTGTNCTQSTGTTTAQAPSESPTCYTSDDPMSFILCPIFNSLSAISNWIFQNILTPFLITAPISTSSSDTSFKIWSSFRVYGDIVLVIALLIAVIGQVIGGGVVDAYTFRKVIPRVLVAAILINLSVYIVAFMVDITNVIGKSIGNVMTAPLAANNAWNFTPSGVESLGVFGAGLLGLLAGAGGVAVIAAVFFGDKNGNANASLVKVALYAAIFIILPIALAMIAVFVTLVIRKGLILFLIMISPIAFALYCLPNTEKYFKKWWDLLLEALLVYPIIVVIFAVADILAVTILSANSITKTQLTPDATGFVTLSIDAVIATLVAFFLQFLPLLAIPFSFRMAGGTLSKLHEAVTSGGGKINEFAQKRGEQAKKDWQTQKLQARHTMYQKLNSGNPDSNSAFFRKRHGFLANRAGGYDINGAMAGMLAEKKKEFDQTTGNGDDTQLRALSVNKKAALAANGGVLTDDGEGNMSNGQFRRTANGSREFKTLGGRWVGEGDVDAAQQRWKGDHDQQQLVLAYEMRKATTQAQNDNLVSNYAAVADGWGMTENDKSSAWTGAAYANQGDKLEMKYYKYKNGNMQMDGQGLMQEVDETRGTYDMSKFKADTWATLQGQTDRAGTVLAQDVNAGLTQRTGETTEAHSARVGQAVVARQQNARETLQRGSRIARSFVQSRGAAAPEFGEEGEPVGTTAAAGGRGGPVVAIHGAAPAAQEAAERFVQSMHEGAEVPALATYAPGESGQPQNRLHDQDRTNTTDKL